VLAANPDAVDALNNRGAVLQDLGQADQALASLTRAIALSPSSPQVRWNLALTQLQTGDFRKRLEQFRIALGGLRQTPRRLPHAADRAWRGEALRGKRLLLWRNKASVTRCSSSALRRRRSSGCQRQCPGGSRNWRI